MPSGITPIVSQAMLRRAYCPAGYAMSAYFTMSRPISACDTGLATTRCE